MKVRAQSKGADLLLDAGPYQSNLISLQRSQLALTRIEHIKQIRNNGITQGKNR